MNSTDFFFLLGDLFQWTFGIFELIGNLFNYFLILVISGGLCYWMNIQRKLNDLSNVPVEIKDNEGWYKNKDQKLK
ncbi:hypothetical protein OAF64_06865 [Crocinitomicaceae bacterium]|jgi:hypothetical protein|nr:hypothetical protein [Crocinitomicaceae bacterium]MDB4649699.1 hypothetical protein [Crocinitomicaceae bacterium]